MMLKLLLFSPGPGLFDRIIDAAEGSPAAPVHAALQISADFYAESVWPYARLMPTFRLPANVRRIPLTCTDTQEAAITAYLLNRVGTMHYSVQVLASDAIGAATGRWLPASHQTADCSGWLAEAFVAAGLVTTLPRDPGEISPADLSLWVAAGMPADLGALLTNALPVPEAVTTTVTVTTSPAVS